jgi:hypothetical protein
MGTAARRQPAPPAPTYAYRDLAAHLRYMLEREGLTPRQLATADDVPYSATMLYRYLSGEELPPPLLIEVVARHCRTHPGALRTAYERARLAAATPPGRRAGTRPAARHSRDGQPAAQTGRVRGRHAKARPKRGTGVRLVMIGAGFSAAGTVVLATTMVPGFDSEPAAAARHVDPTDAPAPATNANGVFQGSPQAPASPPGGNAPGTSPGSAGGGQPGDSGQMVENGTFTGTVGNWLARSDTRIRVDRNRLRININPDTGFDQLLSPAVKYPVPTLRYAGNYVFSFEAAADSKTTIRVTVQSDAEPRARTLSEDVVLGSRMRTFTLPFRSRFELSDPIVGIHVVRDTDKHSIWIDDVSLRHRPPQP